MILLPPASGADIQFEKEVLPILEASCAKCHSGPSPQASLDVRTRASLLKGGSSGPAIVPGAPDKSLLYSRVKTGQMPIGGKPLGKEELDRMRMWIEQGAPARFPEASTAAPGVSPADRAHWAFQPPNPSAIPTVAHGARVRTPIDAFVLAELEKKKLTLSPDADRITLLRRVYFDLIGLPPSPAAIDKFVADTSAGAYQAVVDSLLASPQYGERWGRHWLDAAGYADSEGVLAADVIRTNAWRYRDYVIRAFNSDKPYNRFVTEQLAGDEVSEYRKYDKLPPPVVEALEATGFLRTAVDATREDFQPKDFAEYQWRTFFDTEQIVASSLMGLTMQCARCHDHKYEPISQADYYRLQAFFAGAIRPDGPVLPTYKRMILQATAEEQKAAEKVNGLVDPVAKALKQLKSARTALYRSRHPKGEAATEKELREAFPEYAAKSESLAEELLEAENKHVDLPAIRALYDLDASPPPTKLLGRGDPRNPDQSVEPGVPTVLDDLKNRFHLPKPAADARTTGRRRALAEWLTRPDQPLTARVMVNRIWSGHFGAGIVSSLDNFGRSGAAPTNRPLLDWLATLFVERGWSVKAIHRLIVTSSVYRQASVARPEGLATDPENKLLWRMSPRRLDAEIVRDSILAAAGTLDYTMYGEPVATHTKPSGEVVPVDDTCGGRRSVYQLVRRSSPQSFLNAFDAPVMEINCTRRITSTSATQALALMNSEFVTAQARHFAKRVLSESPGPDEKRVRYAFRIALARPPASAEVDRLLTFLDQQAGRYVDVTPSLRTERVYTDLCQALLSTNEFIYID